MKSIYLIGLPGCGKTTIGLGLSDVLNLPFLDLDSLIEGVEGISISQIFEQSGEDYFREVEKDVLNVLPEGTTIVATGGGAPCFFDNMDFIKKNTLSVYLKISVEELFNRLYNKGAKDRPLLANKTKNELLLELKHKLEYREQFYNQADIVISGDQLTVEDVLQEIKSFNL